MEKRVELEQWRKDAFQISFPNAPDRDPTPDNDIAELSGDYFTSPDQAFYPDAGGERLA